MIDLKEASLYRGPKQLFSQSSMRVHAGDKVALIGPNGAGKSSLFQLFLGHLTLDGGELSIPSDWRLSHMAQSIDEVEQSALDYVMGGDEELIDVVARIEAAREQGDGNQEAKWLSHYETIDGYTAEARASQLLAGLGFAADAGGQSISSFSGGWRGRLSLARALMCRSDLLLLDEPTNHLDVETVDWLAGALRRYQGTLILISHDREFIDAVATHVVALEKQQLQSYRGNYSNYEIQKAERLAQQQAMYKKQQAQRADMERFVERFRYKASKAKQAQSRLKALERMDQIAPAHVDSPFTFKVVARDKMSNPLAQLNDAALGYESKTVLEHVDFNIEPGQRVGLLGANGQGKSTLIKSIVGAIPLKSGERKLGEHTFIGYFAQHQLETLSLDNSCFDAIRALSPEAGEQEVRNFLGGFNFTGDRAFEPIRPFSGGEKTRLALALLVWQKPNLLILDEPTNHLDLEVRHALTMAIQQFEGAVILVSHDQYLLNNSVDEFYLVNQGIVKPYDGSLPEYLAWLRSSASGDTTATKPATSNDKKKQRQDAANLRAAQAPIRKRIKQIDSALEKANQQKESLEEVLADTQLYTTDPDRVASVSKQYSEIKDEIEMLELEWLELSEQLEA